MKSLCVTIQIYGFEWYFSMMLFSVCLFQHFAKLLSLFSFKDDRRGSNVALLNLVESIIVSVLMLKENCFPRKSSQSLNSIPTHSELTRIDNSLENMEEECNFPSSF